jgi:hypothetical protein
MISLKKFKKGVKNMKTISKLETVFDDVIKWGDKDAKLAFLAFLMGILEVEEQCDYLRESFIDYIMHNYNKVKPD